MFAVEEIEIGPGKDHTGRVFVTDGTTVFHVDMGNAQLLADLLNGAAPPAPPKAKRVRKAAAPK